MAVSRGRSVAIFLRSHGFSRLGAAPSLYDGRRGALTPHSRDDYHLTEERRREGEKNGRTDAAGS